RESEGGQKLSKVSVRIFSEKSSDFVQDRQPKKFMDNIQISKGQKDDINTIVEIHKRCVEQTNSKVYDKKVIANWLKEINHENVLSQFENSTWVVAKIDEAIIGFAQYGLDDGVLYQIQVGPAYQGKGYGKLIYKYIEKQFVEAGKSKISLNATLNAKAFYTNLGFKDLGNTYFGNIEMTKMEKQLGF
ncbi:hypothetical protein A2709_03180, partial [candidate division WWE3 bacterium RIFCSPHIGHO2_01_FULL_43_9]